MLLRAQLWEYCDDSGQCLDDVCDQGQTTCASNDTQKICNGDGSAFELVPCEGDWVCYLGLCQAPVCSPDDPPTCEDGQQKVCNSIGTGWTLLPCPGGSGCLGGNCVPVEPNVILLMDTSGSMNWFNAEQQTPYECEGEGCPPWTWPQCDDQEQPQTRLGKAKKALMGILESEAADSVRMALQRFPQKFDIFKLLGDSDPTCNGAPLWGFDLYSSDNTTVNETHEIETMDPEGGVLGEILPVPFGLDGALTQSQILAWIDGEHTYEPTGESCTNLSNCSGPIVTQACIDGQCAESSNPELRAMGQTPIGRALFYAGEILRHLVVVEGQACLVDDDCGSPHYSCVDGQCHDPLGDCRPNLIVLFSDGGETLDTWPDDFFHPRIQAKRLHYGLGCNGDEDCLNGASCQAGVCQPPSDKLPGPVFEVLAESTCYKGLPADDEACAQTPGEGEMCCELQGVCHLTDLPCANNTVCFDYKYMVSGSPAEYSGECELPGFEFVDPMGANLVRDASGRPISATIHVVDASQQTNGNAHISTMGGGQHVPVDLDNPEQLIELFLPLLDVKSNVDSCL